MIYLNETTGKGEVAQLSFHADETAETYKDIFQSLRSFCPTDPPIVIVDKDFTEIECLRETCPSARIILCTFNVIKYMKGVIVTAH